MVKIIRHLTEKIGELTEEVGQLTQEIGDLKGGLENELERNKDMEVQ